MFPWTLTPPLSPIVSVPPGPYSERPPLFSIVTLDAWLIEHLAPRTAQGVRHGVKGTCEPLHSANPPFQPASSI
eukprot:4470471-Prorocentrum_lima.AAC.1